VVILLAALPKWFARMPGRPVPAAAA
jgi:hypothetical protein